MRKLSQNDVERFRADGFLLVERLIGPELVERLKERFAPLFRGEFETGVWPDEWHWREGMSLPDITRHMSGLWKADRTIASVSLSAVLGRFAAELMGWPGARIGLDTLWWKPPQAKEIALHQDATYMAFLDPPEVVTVWIALDDTHRDAGTLEYVPGSHLWPLKEKIGDFHAPDHDYRAMMRAAALAVGVSDAKVVPIEAKAGDCSIHHGRTWHGSDCNRSADRPRRSLGVHLLSSATRFRPEGVGYIFGRYQCVGSTEMDESFFPILWTRSGYRSAHLAAYCRDALTAPAA
jgi:hypothetical protein